MFRDRRHRAGLPTLTDADKIRNALHDLGLSQRRAARELDVNERTMRRYCAGSEYPIPRAIFYALAYLGHIGRFQGGEFTPTGERTPAVDAEPPDPAAPG